MVIGCVSATRRGLREERIIYNQRWLVGKSSGRRGRSSCNGCGQTWSVRELGNGCPECRPRVKGKKEKGKRLKVVKTAAQGTGTTGVPEPVISPPPLAQGEAPETMMTDPPQSEPEALPHRPRRSTRDREASPGQRHTAELKLRCRNPKVSKVKGPSEQVTTGLLMRSALPEEIVARLEGEDVKDTVFTVPLLRDCIINMIHDIVKDIELPLKKGAGKALPKRVPRNGLQPLTLGSRW